MSPLASPNRSPAPVVGLDLAGSPRRDTGACVLTGLRRLRTAVLHSDEEIIDYVRCERPELVVIDAPLSLPRGRATIEDRSGPHLRECDRVLLRMRLPFFPITLGPMRMLTVRGMSIASSIAREGPQVLEGYPGGAQDLLGLPRKNSGVERLQRALRARGLGGDLARRALSHDELDAVTIAWVGWMFRKGHGTLIGDPSEGVMLLPEPGRRRAIAERARGPGRRPARR
ncbi:MAG TPA: DUF429 domain-containing protein [Thermoplasmata archaeon]|nr:DUF429 domain-containing protein [Thermoplasmata archaeon]